VAKRVDANGTGCCIMVEGAEIWSGVCARRRYASRFGTKCLWLKYPDDLW
jgi:hypothetical protein